MEKRIMKHFFIFGKLFNKQQTFYIKRLFLSRRINFLTLRQGHQFVRLFTQENIPREEFENESFQYIERNKLIDYIKNISFNVKDIFKINEIGSDLKIFAILGFFSFFFFFLFF